MVKRLLAFIGIFCSVGVLQISKCFAEEYKFEDIGYVETDRLVLEPTTESDLNVLSEYLMDSNVTKYLDPSIKKGFSSKKEALEFLESEGECDTAREFTVKLKDDKISIGKIDAMIYRTDCGNMLMLGYWLGKSYQGKGYAREASYNFANKFFSASDVSSVYISCISENSSGCRLANDIISYLVQHNENLELEKEDYQLEIEVEPQKSIKVNILRLKKLAFKVIDAKMGG